MASSLSNTAAVTRSLAARSVHVKIRPRPRGLGESGRVLGALQEKFGEVVAFRWLKFEPDSPAHNTAIALFRREDAASKAVQTGSVRLDLEGERDARAVAEEFEDEFLEEQEPEEEPITLRYPPVTITSKKAKPSLPASPSPQASKPRSLMLTLSPSSVSHRAYVRRQAYYGPFRCEPASHPGTGTLGPLPGGMKGLQNSNLDAAEVQLRVRRKREAEGEKWRGLGELWKEGLRGKEAKVEQENSS